MKTLKFMLVFLVIGLLMAGCGTVKETPKPADNTPVEKTFVQDWLVSVDWLKENLGNPDVIILDARVKGYDGGHIPGAIHTPWQSFANMAPAPGEPGWGVLLPADQLGPKLAALGLSNDKTIVIYADTDKLGEAGRTLWMLQTAGITTGKILDGGWGMWLQSAGVNTVEVPVPTPSDFTVTALDETLNVTTEWLLANLNNVKIIDARSTEEFNGTVKYGEKRPGHIPGAISIPFNDTQNADGTFKSPAELAALFSAAGLSPDDTIVSYCTAGIRSGQLTMVLRMMGYDKARNYDASMQEWAGNPDLPLE